MTEIHENDEMAERDGEHSQIKWYEVRGYMNMRRYNMHACAIDREFEGGSE